MLGEGEACPADPVVRWVKGGMGRAGFPKIAPA